MKLADYSFIKDMYKIKKQNKFPIASYPGLESIFNVIKDKMESEINSLLDQWCQYDLILKPKNVGEKYFIDSLFETNKDFEIRCKGIDAKFDANTHERIIECNRATISKKYTFEHPQINQSLENNNKYISIGFNPITKQIDDVDFFNNENNTCSLLDIGKMNLNRLVQKETDKSINADKINNSLSSFKELLRIFQNDTKKRLNLEIKKRDLNNFFTNFSDLMKLIKNNSDVEKSIKQDCSEIHLNNMDSFYDLMLMLHDANKIENKNLVKFKKLKL